MLDTVRLKGIGQIALTVSDLDQAVHFYHDILGLEFLFRADPGLAFLVAGDIRIMLTCPEGNSKVGQNSPIYFWVDDCAAAQQFFAANGAIIEGKAHLIARMPDHDLWMAFLRDPDGNLVGLMEKRKSPESI